MWRLYWSRHRRSHAFNNPILHRSRKGGDRRGAVCAFRLPHSASRAPSHASNAEAMKMSKRNGMTTALKISYFIGLTVFVITLLPDLIGESKKKCSVQKDRVIGRSGEYLVCPLLWNVFCFAKTHVSNFCQRNGLSAQFRKIGEHRANIFMKSFQYFPHNFHITRSIDGTRRRKSCEGGTIVWALFAPPPKVSP